MNTQPTTTPSRPSLLSSAAPRFAIRFRPVLRVVLAFASWAMVTAALLLSAALAGWVLLGAVLLGGGQLAVVALLAVLLAVTAGLAWLVAKYVASWRAVGWTLGLMTLALAVAWVTWALSAPDKALFLAREMAWDGAKVSDYEKYPARVVANAPPGHSFKQSLSPQLFQAIEYRAGGQLRQTSLDQFLGSTGTTSFIVARDDTVVYEGYFNGYGRDSVVTSFSAAKSVTSALVGIAIDEEAIRSINDPMVWYLPELRGRGLDGMTIRHLLTMSSGIRHTRPEDLPSLLSKWPFTDKTMAYSYPDLRRLALAVHADGLALGARFNYNDYNPLLLGLILERTTHRPLAEYLQEKIWKPLGMEYPASWSMDSQASAFEKTEVGVNARAIDFAKFARLFLNNGNWNGQQVISARWVVESTAPDRNDARPFSPPTAAEWKAANGYYKFLWWGKLQPDGSYVYMARGAEGQWIVVAPSARVVLVRFGTSEGGVDVDTWMQVFQAVIAKAR